MVIAISGGVTHNSAVTFIVQQHTGGCFMDRRALLKRSGLAALVPLCPRALFAGRNLRRLATVGCGLAFEGGMEPF
jgi:hypothetical protein